MGNEYAAVPRVFNDAVQNAKRYRVDSLNQTQGYYTNDGWARVYSDGYGNSKTYTDLNHDHWVDEIQETRFGQKYVEIENTNPSKDKTFDLYKEYQNGKLHKLVEDSNYDGKYDRVTIYENGRITQMIEDKTKDEEPDLYTFYDKDGRIAEKIDTRSGWEKLLDRFFGK